jgi:deoxyribonuclease-1
MHRSRWSVRGLVPLGLLAYLMGGAHLSWAQNTRIDSFEAAKKLAPQIYADHPEEFYCGCRYSGTAVDLASCG